MKSWKGSWKSLWQNGTASAKLPASVTTMKELYVTEPDVIDMQEVKRLLPSGRFTVTSGQASFEPGFISPAQALLIRSNTTVDATIKQFFPQLRAVIRVGTGLDNVDVDFCRSEGIEVFNAAGANADAVAEYVTAMILYVKRGLHRLNPQDVASWNRFAFRGQGIAGQTVGIVGYGNIGKLLQQKLAGLGCTKFLVYDPYVPADMIAKADAVAASLPELLRQSDIISLHLPLLPETHHSINAEKLDMLKDGALLINAARGGIVDEAALLVTNKDVTYVADTVENEPDVNPELLERENVIITPHIASLTADSERAMVRVALTNYLEKHL